MPHRARTLAATVASAWLALVATTAAAPAAAQDTYSGFLCCNMRSDGRWISDINYAESGKFLLPLGTPVTITGYGRQRVLVEIKGQAQALGNDYSRDMPLDAFAQRYVLREDPAPRLAAWPEKVQRAVRSARVTRGMTREQVVMAVGYPITSENPHLDAPDWRYWLHTFQEFRVFFDDAGQVREVRTDPDTRRIVVLD